MKIASGTTDQYIYFVAVDSTDYVTRETALSSFTVYRSRDGAAAAAMTTPTINETDVTNMPGVYELLLDEDMTIGSGNDTEEMVFHITHAGMAPVSRTIELYRSKITAGNTLDVTATGAAGIDWGNVENPTTVVDLSGTDIQLADTVTTLTGHTAQTADHTAGIADIPTVAEFNARTLVAASYFDPAADTVATVTDVTTKTGYSLSTAGILAIWHQATAAIVTAGTIGKLLVDNVNAAIGSASTHSAADVWTVATRVLTAGTNLNDISTADVNAQVLDVLNTDTFAEPASVPAATASLVDKIGWLMALARNKLTQTATTATLRNDADGADIATSTVSDDGTTATRAEWT